jgi:K+ transporter
VRLSSVSEASGLRAIPAAGGTDVSNIVVIVVVVLIVLFVLGYFGRGRFRG